MFRQIASFTTPLKSFAINGKSVRMFTDNASNSKNIFVGNLPWEATESDIMDFFSKYGTVSSVKLMKDGQTGRPRGFGFITLAGEPDKAIAELDGKDLKGRAVRINEAKPPAPRDPNAPRYNGGGGFGGDRGGDRGFQRGGDRSFGGDRGGDRGFQRQDRGDYNRGSDRGFGGENRGPRRDNSGDQ